MAVLYHQLLFLSRRRVGRWLTMTTEPEVGFPPPRKSFVSSVMLLLSSSNIQPT